MRKLLFCFVFLLAAVRPAFSASTFSQATGGTFANATAATGQTVTFASTTTSACTIKMVTGASSGSPTKLVVTITYTVDGISQ